MPRPTQAKLRSLKAINCKRSILFVVHPHYEDWLTNKISKETMVKGCTVSSAPRNHCFEEVIKDLKDRILKKEKYDCLILVPGHGCEIKINVILTKAEIKSGKYGAESKTKEVNSKPGIVWSRDPLDKDNEISKERLTKLINQCMSLTRHLHLCTCWQGCILNEYNKMIPKKYKDTYTYVLSGWKNALLLNDKEVDLFISNGCHPRTELDLKEKFGYIKFVKNPSVFTKDEVDFSSSEDVTTTAGSNTSTTATSSTTTIAATTTTTTTTTTNVSRSGRISKKRIYDDMYEL